MQWAWFIYKNPGVRETTTWTKLSVHESRGALKAELLLNLKKMVCGIIGGGDRKVGSSSAVMLTPTSEKTSYMRKKKTKVRGKTISYCDSFLCCTDMTLLGNKLDTSWKMMLWDKMCVFHIEQDNMHQHCHAACVLTKPAIHCYCM